MNRRGFIGRTVAAIGALFTPRVIANASAKDVAELKDGSRVHVSGDARCGKLVNVDDPHFEVTVRFNDSNPREDFYIGTLV